VYIAALAPDQGETVAKVFYRDELASERIRSKWGR
jgi:hypothetical protein